MGIRVLIADDEPLARERMVHLLGAFPDLELVAQASSGPETLALCQQTRPQLLFLDIRMPGLSGIDVADLLRESQSKPLIVFVSAYDQHALEAFEVEALDYLTKPIRPSRLATTLARARERLQHAADLNLGAAPVETPSPSKVRTGPPEPAHEPLPNAANPALELLGVPVGEKTELIELDNLLYVLTTEGSLDLHTQARVYHTPWALKRLEERLDSDPRFLKISRQCIVQLRYIKAIDPFFSGTSKLIMADGARLEASRAATKRLKALFD